MIVTNITQDRIEFESLDFHWDFSKEEFENQFGFTPIKTPMFFNELTKGL